MLLQIKWFWCDFIYWLINSCDIVCGVVSVVILLFVLVFMKLRDSGTNSHV